MVYTRHIHLAEIMMLKFTPYNSFTRIHKLAKPTRGSRLPIQVVNVITASKIPATVITMTIQF
jgi:hypothetical protein